VSEAFLADACALIVFFTGQPERVMSARALAIMTGADLHISSITVWEITRKASLGRLPALPQADGSFSGWLLQAGFRMLPLTWRDAERANALPLLHKDPMDRMLTAAALAGDFTVITEDRVFAKYGVRTLW
jgi:PIN domain nuclease of toxin-antitoxin system